MSQIDRLRVLLIDDEKELLEAYVASLESTYEVKAHSEPDLIPISDFEWADVLVADFNMPKRNGVEVMNEMLSSGIEKPVIFISGYVPDLLNELKSIQTIEVFSKPMSLKDLSFFVDLYASYSREIKRLQASLLNGVTNAKQLSKKVIEFNEEKSKMLAQLRKKADARKS